MQHLSAPWPDPAACLARMRPDAPVLFLSPATLQATARRFQCGFPGLVTYAVKANDRAEVLANLDSAGIAAFDVASPAEMRAVRAINPAAVLHYNNPVRSPDEVAAGTQMGVASWSIDEDSELDKLRDVPRGAEIAVRFALPVRGAAYDFGEKFGAAPERAADLLRRVAEGGWRPALCFHPGTQCEDPGAWESYIEAAARIAARAGVRIARLNVGGGFAAHRTGPAPDLEAVFARIGVAVTRAFGPDAPALICEPGRAMVSEAFTLAARIKAQRDGGETIFLNDGIYGGLTDLRDMGLTGRVRVLAPDGAPRRGPPRPRRIFGPTCDSLDRLPDGLALPADAAPGDYVLFAGMGAYSVAMSTGFNGYGLRDVITVLGLTGHCPHES
ncbi:type III PLP-dependent enzyme [Antarcticimicrobium luteum]|uniref:ornithine decarboxylase n=1 Tax=Antarcticimicrobium luteum TaxID=2547397 RepID=A0A4R5VC78_9RHOB|nr:type III PLP-dependent enzyme [Antarcticimicrobium luteum]TDK49674.1 type III PLP-dependent enzyme [Antarcticimicrobium luteum]